MNDGLCSMCVVCSLIACRMSLFVYRSFALVVRACWYPVIPAMAAFESVNIVVFVSGGTIVSAPYMACNSALVLDGFVVDGLKRCFASSVVVP